MRTINTEFYGDDSRWFIGVVSQIGDVRNLGRVRVRIFGIHNEDTTKVKISDLPWASVVVPVTQGGVSGSTMPDGIQVGAQVYGIFLDGKHSQSPLILGSIPHDSGLRVVSEEPIDNFAVPQPASQEINVKPGDIVTEEAAATLETLGMPPPIVGSKINTEEAIVLDKSTAGSGNLDIDLIGATRQEQAYNFLKSYFQLQGNIGDPGICAAAFVGNFIHESTAALDPTIPGDGGQAIGIAQWNARRPDLLLFASKIPGASHENFTVQLAFVRHELENKQANRTYARLVNSSTVTEYTEVVMALYETPLSALNYHRETSFIRHYNLYARNGGIRGAALTGSGQSSAFRNYLAAFELRLQTVKKVAQKFGDS
jgi:hypothetical protein